MYPWQKAQIFFRRMKESYEVDRVIDELLANAKNNQIFDENWEKYEKSRGNGEFPIDHPDLERPYKDSPDNLMLFEYIGPEKCIIDRNGNSKDMDFIHVDDAFSHLKEGYIGYPYMASFRIMLRNHEEFYYRRLSKEEVALLSSYNEQGFANIPDILEDLDAALIQEADDMNEMVKDSEKRQRSQIIKLVWKNPEL